MEIQNYLDNALERLFLNKTELGYWDDSENRIIESLHHDEEWNWNYKSSKNYRYSLFCMGMLLLSKEIYGLNTDKYDDKIKKFLVTIKLNKRKFSNTDLTYGALLSLILGKKIYGLDLIDEETKSLFFKNLEGLLNTTDNQNFLLLIAAKYFQQIYASEKIVELINKVQKRIIKSLHKKFYFDTGDFRAAYHQRIMYTLWGLIFSSPFDNSEEIRNIANGIINFIYENRRLEDNSFIFHPPIYSINYHGIRIPVLSLRSSKYLYACHQTFFVNAINFYRYFYKEEKAFEKEKNHAMEWIWGKNRNNKNLIEVTGIHLPPRFMNLDGNHFLAKENFKGSYEIGSYILSLSEIVFSSKD